MKIRRTNMSVMKDGFPSLACVCAGMSSKSIKRSLFDFGGAAEPFAGSRNGFRETGLADDVAGFGSANGEVVVCGNEGEAARFRNGLFEERWELPGSPKKTISKGSLTESSPDI